MYPDTQDQKADRLRNYTELAETHYKSGKLELALEACRQALMLDPNSVSLHLLSGRILYTLKDDEMAEKEAARAGELDPTSEEAQNLLAVLLLRQGKKAEARALLQSAIHQNPRLWKLHENLAFTYYSESNFRRAAAEYWSAFRLHPSQLSLAESVINLALAYPVPGRLLFMAASIAPFLIRSPWGLLFTIIPVLSLGSSGYINFRAGRKTRSYFLLISGFLILLLHLFYSLVRK